jgi:hypothetical protein
MPKEAVPVLRAQAKQNKHFPRALNIDPRIEEDQKGGFLSNIGTGTARVRRLNYADLVIIEQFLVLPP